MQGLDASHECSNVATKIRQAGLGFVGRYYSHSAWKNLSAGEAQILCSAGLKLVAVWESAGDSYGFFSRTQGLDDVTSACSMATKIGQPPGTPIYFAVDFDASAQQVSAAIHDYFLGLQAGMALVSQGNGGYYKIGAYGSGFVCDWLYTRQLVSHTWLACSSGWTGSQNYSGWSIKQSTPSDNLGLGFSVDPDEALGDYGGFSVPVTAPAVA